MKEFIHGMPVSDGAEVSDEELAEILLADGEIPVEFIDSVVQANPQDIRRAIVGPIE